MPTLEELRQQRREMDAQKKALDKQIAEAEERELKRKRDEVWEKIEDMSEEDKEYILSHMEHESKHCESMHDGGWSYSRDRFDCKKCMLMEIFNSEHGGRFDFKLTVEIEEVTVY